MTLRQSYKSTEEQVEIVRAALREFGDKMHEANLPAVVLVVTEYNGETEEVDIMGLARARKIPEESYMPPILELVLKVSTCPGIVELIGPREINTLIALANTRGHWRTTIERHNENKGN